MQDQIEIIDVEIDDGYFRISMSTVQTRKFKDDG